MVSSLLHPLLNLSGLPVYLVVGALVFGEAAILIGFVLPGETAVIVGGVIAGRHHASLPVLIVVVVVCAIVGDSVGYWVGQKFGPWMLNLRLVRRRRRAVDYTTGLIERRGGWAVFMGRFTAFLRAMVPGLAGMSALRYRTFLTANAAGGLLWGIGYCVLGFVVGNAYSRVEQYSNWASYVLLAALLAAFAFAAVRSRRRERTLLGQDRPRPAGPGTPAAATGEGGAGPTPGAGPAPGPAPDPAADGGPARGPGAEPERDAAGRVAGP